MEIVVMKIMDMEMDIEIVESNGREWIADMG
jgi:hypothetical protein